MVSGLLLVSYALVGQFSNVDFANEYLGWNHVVAVEKTGLVEEQRHHFGFEQTRMEVQEQPEVLLPWVVYMLTFLS